VNCVSIVLVLGVVLVLETLTAIGAGFVLEEFSTTRTRARTIRSYTAGSN